MLRKKTENKERQNLPISISLINNNFFEDLDFDSVTEYIMGPTAYRSQQLRQHYTDVHPLRVYYLSEPKPVRWLAYLKPAVAEGAAILSARNHIASFVFFIGSGDYIFTLTGGVGKFEVQDFLDRQFGIDILTRLVPKDSVAIRAIQDKGVTGSVLGESRFYRGKQRLTDEDQFGKVYSQINAELNKGILHRRLGFSEAEIAKGSVGCWAQVSFQLGKSISFDRTLTLVDQLSTLLSEEAPYTLNNVRLIRPQGEQNRILIARLLDRLKTVLYEDCINDRVPNFDFCHSNFEAYLTASDFFIDLDGEDDFEESQPPTLSTVIQHFKGVQRWTIDTVGEFDIGFLQQRIISFDADGTEATNASILHHFHGEISFEEHTYFYLDKQWYWIEDAFISELNDQCQTLINQCLEEKLITLPFEASRSESVFNDQFMGQANWITLDTITANNIESCDILHYTQQNIYFIHVKKGFNNSIRELASQVHLSARRIAHDKLGSYSYISAIEEQAKVNHKSDNLRLQKIAKQQFPAGGLSGLLRSKNPEQIVFCLAFVDTNLKEHSIKAQLLDFHSNIAKFSLLKLSRDIRQYGFQFKIIQLKKDNKKSPDST